MASEALILAWVRRTLGTTAACVDERPTRHGQTRVVQVLDGQGRSVAWWKQASNPDGAQREADALRAVARVDAGAVPSLLDHDVGRGWLLLRHVEGTRWSSRPRNSSQDDELGIPLAEGLGRWRRLLDALDVPLDPMPMEAAIVSRREAWRARARGLVDPVTLEALADRVDASRFVGARRSFCHRDLDPDNVIWPTMLHDGAQTPVVLDFGQSRPDHPLVDAVRLEVAAFQGDVALLEAFLRAWRGCDLDADERARFESLLALELLGTWAWAARHGDEVFLRRAQEAWERLRSR